MPSPAATKLSALRLGGRSRAAIDVSGNFAATAATVLGHVLIPANEINVAGAVVDVFAFGTMAPDGADTLTLTVELISGATIDDIDGSIDAGTRNTVFSVADIPAATALRWCVHAQLVTRIVGNSGDVAGGGYLIASADGTDTGLLVAADAVADTTVDLTVPLELAIVALWSAAGETIQLEHMNAQVFLPFSGTRITTPG